jgi:ribonuclease BN (tRNA processing enzyme)
MSSFLHFIGTGAADHDWKNIGAPGVRGSSCMLLDGHILLDAGVTAAVNLERFGVDPDVVTDLLVTHTHIDHFDPAAIGKIIAARSADAPLLHIHCSPEGAEILRRNGLDTQCKITSVKPGDVFLIGETQVTALPSNHLIKERFAEETMWYLFRMKQGNLLYALDGAWITTRTAEMLRGITLDWAVWDATVHQTADHRSFEHNDLTMVEMIIKALQTRKTATEKTVHILTHFARTLWPDEETTRRIVEEEHGKIMAYDGLKV